MDKVGGGFGAGDTMIAAMRVDEMTITAMAPVRICDLGGWTDTWFARHGAVCSLAISPFAEVQVIPRHRAEQDERIVIHAENFGLRYGLRELLTTYDKLPLVEAAIRRMAVPSDIAFEINIWCQVPPGASTGTSAAVSVAIIGALDRLRGGTLSPPAIARLAHAIEVEDLQLQSGVQDQYSSACGGANLIEISSYPETTLTPIELDGPFAWELERRLTLVCVGRLHQSSALHLKVIESLGEQAALDPRLDRLRQVARQGSDALRRRDLPQFAGLMRQNTDLQRQLHPGLVGEAFERIIAIAAAHRALGWKVNGAGGSSGSVSILSDDRSASRRSMIAEFQHEGFEVIPTRLSTHGLRVWSEPSTTTARSSGAVTDCRVHPASRSDT